MRRFLLVLATTALVAGMATSAAAGPTFPDWIPFDREAGEFPEGVAVDKAGNVYVSIDGLGQIWKFTPAGEKSVLVDFEGSGALGLAVDAPGNVYVARGRLNKGVWKVDPFGNAELIPGTEAIAASNALAFDKRGNLYVSETFSLDDPIPYDCAAAGGPYLPGFGAGAIWVVPKGGEAELWLRDGDLLTGLCLFPLPFPIGANGIAFRHGAVYVNNTEKAIVVKVPVLPDGSAGIAEVFAQVTGVDPLFGPPGLDGMALDVHGNIYVPIVNQSRIVRISADGTTVEDIATLADGLDFPASLAFGTGDGERRSLFITNYSLGPPTLAGPGLVKLAVDDVGMPLP